MADKIMPVLAILFVLILVIYVRKSNPQNKKIRKRTSIESLVKSQICPKCGIKMNKTWAEKDLGYSDIEFDSIIEKEIRPEFICSKCNYKIKADFYN